MRLHRLAAPDGTPRACGSGPADQKEREVPLRLFLLACTAGEMVVADAGYTGRELATLAAHREHLLVIHPGTGEAPATGTLDIRDRK